MLVVMVDIFIVAMLIWAAASDLATMTIPNSIVSLFLIGYIVIAPFAGISMLPGLWSGLLALAGTLVLFSCGWIGGGDAKLFTVTALWLGLDHLVPLVLATSVAGAMLTIGMLALRSQNYSATWLGRPWVARLLDPQRGVPYGIAIAFAGCAVLATSA